jgi:hypothetical protein
MEPSSDQNQNKLCPFSMSFAMPEGKPIAIIPGTGTQRIKIGLPCVKRVCKGWDETEGNCFIQVLLALSRYQP